VHVSLTNLFSPSLLSTGAPSSLLLPTHHSLQHVTFFSFSFSISCIRWLSMA
jgi:hypothetical protein